MSTAPLRPADMSGRLLEFQGFMDRLLANKTLSREETFHALADHFAKASHRDRQVWAEVFMARLCGLLLVPDGSCTATDGGA